MNDSDELIPMNEEINAGAETPAPKKRGRRPGSTKKKAVESAVEASAVPAAQIQPAAVPAEKENPGENVVVSYSYVGVALDTMPAATFRENSRPGVQAVYVLKNSPADKAGIKSGDVLLSLDGQKLFFPTAFLWKKRAGS